MQKIIAAFVMCLVALSLPAQRPAHYLVENKGQWPSHVIGAAGVTGGRLFLERGSLTYHVYDLEGLRNRHDKDAGPTGARGHVYRMSFVGAQESSMRVLLSEKQSTYSNYFLGNDPAHWAGGCNHFLEAEIQSLYPGIHLKMHAAGSFLKYDLIVEAGAETDVIAMKYEGQTSLQIDHERLVVETSIGDVTEQKPLAWQIINGTKHLIPCRYNIKGNVVSFDFPKGYNRAYDLIIDPELVFSTYSGSTSDNFGYTATYDQEGFLYSGSSAFGQNYPTTLGSYDQSHNGGDSSIEQGIDIALSKYGLDGTTMMWSTFLGGSGDEVPHSIIANELEELIVYGSTGSSDYPITSNAYSSSFAGGGLLAPSGTGANFPNGTDIILSRIASDGSNLESSTYVGGSGNDGICDATALKYNYADEFRGEVELDDDGNILIVSSTRSTDLTTNNAIQSSHGGGLDALIAKFNTQLTQTLWLTYFGGTGDDSGFSISNNSLGEHFICGGTTSAMLNLTEVGAQPSYAGGSADAFVLKLSQAGNQLNSGTYRGSDAYDQAYFIEVDNEDNVYIYGQTAATGSVMIQNAAYNNPNSGNFITKYTPNLDQIIWSTVIGTGSGKPNLSPTAFLVDYCNRVYISGWGVSAAAGNPLNPGNHLEAIFNMPITNDAFDNLSTTGDFYMAVFDENMTNLEYATFFGGSTSQEHVDGGTSRFDRKGVIYQSVCAGCGGNDDFPIFPSNAWSSTNGSSCNNGVFKFDFQLPLTVAEFFNEPTDCIGNQTNFINASSGADSYLWDFGDGTTSTQTNPNHIYTAPGIYTITLTATSNSTCNGTDSIQHTVTITEPVQVELEDIVVCAAPNNVLSVPSTSGMFSWSPSANLSDPDAFSTFYTGLESQNFTITQNDFGCITTYTLHADVLQFDLVTADTLLCEPDEVTLSASFSPADALIAWSYSNDWGFNELLNDDSTDVDIIVQAIESDVYYVQISSGACSIESSVLIDLAFDLTTVEADFTICTGEEVTIDVENPNAALTYSWSPEEPILSGQNSPSIVVLIGEPTLFTVQSISQEGCTASDSVLVSLSTLNPAEVDATANQYTIASGESALLNAQPIGFSYSWSPAESLNNASIHNPLASPSQTTIYTVTISDSYCTATDSVEIRVLNLICGPPNIFVPNTFTPNADGKNEKLYVRGLNLTNVHLSIYNRWGQLVFETTSQNEGWDGTFKDMKVDPDVFVYYLEATCAGGEEYFEKGNVTVIR